MSSLIGKVAVISGGGSGIGKSTALLMAKHGASVVVADIRSDAAQSVADEIRASGGTASAFKCDVGEAAEIAALVNHARTSYGRLDILHNNAALLDPAVMERDQTVLTIEADDWDQVMSVNVRSVLLGCKYAIPLMVESGGGSIINTSSTYGMGAYINLPAYGTSKAAINHLTRYVAAAFGRQGIRCNAVAPSIVATPNVLNYFPEELLQSNKDGSSMGVLVTPEDIAEAVLFLASDAARHISGQILAVDAGSTAMLSTTAAGRLFFENIK